MTGMLPDTKWVATIKTQDAITIHLEASRVDLQATYEALAAQFGPQMEMAWSVAEVPATWVCDGRDGCLVPG